MSRRKPASIAARSSAPSGDKAVRKVLLGNRRDTALANISLGGCKLLKARVELKLFRL